jgi:iron complex outermembrane receptor protein
MRKYLLLLLISTFTTCVAFAQNGSKLVTGKLLDAQTNDPLIGATITVKGTTKAVSALLDGSFKIQVPEGNNTLMISYIGYVTKEIEITERNLGVIKLDPTSASMKEVNITGSSSVAINRQTPVASSTVNQAYIEEKGAGQDFPELLKETPGISFTTGDGGYGQSMITLRGFGSSNVALLVNGIPVNDPQAGRIYWSDFTGLADVTSSIQVQRGLSATDIAVPSIGGTINITTLGTQSKEGGSISQSIGSYNALKTVLSYSTGLSDKGWSTSFLLSKSSGTMPAAQGLYYTGYNYFANISKILGQNQTLSFTLLGSSQDHAVRYLSNTISTYRLQGSRFNSDYGIYNGNILSADQNVYSKPLGSLKYDWKIDDKSSWSTVLYASIGTGSARYLNNETGVPRLSDQYSPIDFNTIAKTNAANPSGQATNWFLDNQGDNQQYGLISTYKRKIGDYLHFLAGVDLRYYTVENYDKVEDLLGGAYVLDTRTATSGNANNPSAHVGVGGKYYDDYRYKIQSEGGYLQLEYVKNNLSAFVNVAASNTSNGRTDYFNYLAGTNNKSPWLNFLGYQAKGGLNYNVDSHSNFYVNGGYIQRAPLVGTLFLNYKNDVNTNAKPEKLLDYEIGYHYESPMFTGSVDAYNATYRDRAQIFTDPAQNADGSYSVANISGINERHEGIEFEGKFRPANGVTLSGSLSVGNFYYLSNTGATQITSTAPGSTPYNVKALYLKGQKIGDFGTSLGTNSNGAQTTAFLGLDVKVLPQVKVGADYTYYSRYYGTYNLSQLTAPGYSTYNIPNYGVMAMNVVYRFKLAGLDASFIGNVYNLFNTMYITTAYDRSIPLPVGGVINYTKAQQQNAVNVYYGAPRYYMTTLKIKF